MIYLKLGFMEFFTIYTFLMILLNKYVSMSPGFVVNYRFYESMYLNFWLSLKNRSQSVEQWQHNVITVIADFVAGFKYFWNLIWLIPLFQYTL